MNQLKEYGNYIPIGYFCSVAMELERIGLRSCSYPLDWLLTPETSTVFGLIENGFAGFLDPEALVRDDTYPQVFHNTKLGISFHHDFKADMELQDQIDAVNEKYRRRIARFYADIDEPTLFIRYISDESGYDGSKSDDLRWIEDNLDHIMEVIRSYNRDNDVLWIANSTIRSDVIPIYHVEKDENDTVARRPLDKNRELNDYLTGVHFADREENLRVYERKQRKKNSLIAKVRRKIVKS